MSAAETARPKLFSIVLATYNCGRKAERTIKSVLSQNRDLFELIVVDGASTDDTLSCIKEYAGDITLISEKDTGVYDAFNKGIDVANGKYLYFIGAGDYLRKNVLETVSKYLTSSQMPAVIYGDAYLVNEEVFYGGEFSESRIKLRNLCHQSAFYDFRIFEMFGKYETKYNIFADWSLNLRCFGDRRVETRHVESVIVDFEGGGLSSTTDDLNFKKDYPKLIRDYLGLKSYVSYQATVLSWNLYWKVYFPFFRPSLRTLMRRSDSERK